MMTITWNSLTAQQQRRQAKQKPERNVDDVAHETDLIGQVIGRLTVLQFLGPKGWRCRCECGAEVRRQDRWLRVAARKELLSACKRCHAKRLELTVKPPRN